jgi:UDP-N-acetylglucosamine transferase subunit ALG13
MEEAMDYIQKSQLVISHAGIGTIILCKKYGIPILILPRRKKHREHMNDHQLEIAEALGKREEENIYIVYDEDQLEEKILKILDEGPKANSSENLGRVHLIRTIQEFIKAT